MDDDPDLNYLIDLTRPGSVMFNRESVIRFLLRRPGALKSRIAPAAVLVLAGAGGGFLVWSAAATSAGGPCWVRSLAT